MRLDRDSGIRTKGICYFFAHLVLDLPADLLERLLLGFGERQPRGDRVPLGDERLLLLLRQQQSPVRVGLKKKNKSLNYCEFPSNSGWVEQWCADKILNELSSVQVIKKFIVFIHG